MIRRAFDPESVAVVIALDELVAYGRLWNARGGVYVVMRFAGHGGGRMQSEKSSHATAAEPGALQNAGRSDGPRREYHDGRFGDQRAAWSPR